MAKSKNAGSSIDFSNLNPDDLGRMKQAVKAIAEYLSMQKSHGESIRDTLTALVENLNADKDSAKKAKKYVRIAARAYVADNSSTIVEDHSAIENLLKALGELK